MECERHKRFLLHIGPRCLTRWKKVVLRNRNGLLCWQRRHISNPPDLRSRYLKLGRVVSPGGPKHIACGQTVVCTKHGHFRGQLWPTIHVHGLWCLHLKPGTLITHERYLGCGLLQERRMLIL
mmetsp:Transcript_32999/g.87805  ORF Transcript_32999/g.87805 Transcript_32999/m.87805 type:complete len:123 (-) Transcript_32999:787-1155(-)